MSSFFGFRQISTSFKWPTLRIEPELAKALLVSQVFAVAWWFIVYFLTVKLNYIAWLDQRTDFLTVFERWLTPYVNARFVYVPWTVIPLIPFHFVPFYTATLIQTCLYFGLLTLVIFKFGGGMAAALLVFTSFIPLETVTELNIQWLTYLGLLVPSVLSGPLLLIRPQDALGVWFSFKREELVRAIIVSLLVFLISLIIWGFWPSGLATTMQAMSSTQSQISVAPARFISYPISIIIGLLIAWRAVKRHDPVFAILAWLFFVPYLTFYSLLLPFAVFSIRFPRIALFASVLSWIIYGGAILLALTR